VIVLQPVTQARLDQDVLGLLRLMRADVNTIRAFVHGSVAKPAAQNAATDLVAWSGRIGELFPPDEAPKQYADMTPAMANGAPAAMRGATEPLLAAVKSGSPEAAGEQLARTEHDGCGYCHLQPYPQ
jgi:hypothetical protein